MHASNSTTNSAIIGIYKLLLITFVFSTLYIAQSIVIPLTIAALLTFLLSPLVCKLEKYVGRIPSILLVVVIVFSLIAFVIFVFTRQFILFGSNFPTYGENIKLKLQGFSVPDFEIFNRVNHLFDNFKDLLIGDSADLKTLGANFEFKIIDWSSNFINFAGSFFGSFFNTLVLIGIVLLLVIFMLLDREDIRSRIIKLMGHNKISSTTLALDDASERVFIYLSRLLVVNVCFGVSVTIGLILIGVPSPVLWGCFAAVLRFVPYVGSWIAAIIPIVLAFVTTVGWMTPVLTILFFIALELTTAYMVEPFYYGRGTGVSAFALILAAIFWTWLWGPIGLLLSTPLTVCLVVLGKYVTNMRFLDVLLSQDAPLNEMEECYHHLLSMDAEESIDLIEDYLKKDSLISIYDSLLIPIIAKTEHDYRHEFIDSDKKAEVFERIYDVIDFFKMEKNSSKYQDDVQKKILCLPLHSARDDIAAKMIQNSLPSDGYEVTIVTKLHRLELSQLIQKLKPNIILIISVSPFLTNHLYQLARFLHQTTKTPIFISLLGAKEAQSKLIDQLEQLGVSRTSFSLIQTLKCIDHLN